MFNWDVIPTNYTVSKFYFPLSKDDLLSNDHLYSDSKINLSSEEVMLQSLASVLSDIRSSPLFVLIHFDVLASALFHFGKIPVPQIVDALDLFYRSGKEFINLIQSLSKSPLDKQAEFNDSHSNLSSCCLMRLVYLISEWTSELFKILKSHSHFASEMSKSNSKFKDINLNSYCQKSIELIASFLSSEIKILFTHSFQELFIDTIRFILNPIYIFLSQNPLLSKCSATMVECYSRCLNKIPSLLIETGVKILEILQLAYLGTPSQTLSPALLNFFDQLITLLPNLGFQMMREIVSRIDLERDSSEIRIFGMMLAVVTSLNSDPEYANVKLVIPLLNAECYTVRNGALTVIAHMIRCSEIKPPKTSEDFHNDSEVDSMEISTDTDDVPLLSHLVKSLFDCNAFVRARCITLIASLWEQDLIPIDVQNEILNTIVGRLCDKCALVRKNALGLMVISLRKNPFKTQSFDIAAFQKSLEREVGILKEFQDKNAIKTFDLDLHNIESDLHSGIKDIIDDSEYLCSVNEANLGEISLFDRLESEIAIGYVPDCITALDLLKKHYPDHKLFKLMDNEETGEILLSLTRSDLLVLSSLLKQSETKNEGENQADTEFIRNQEKKVLFLRTGISFIENFSLSLKKALSLIRSKAHSDVTAVISYLSEYNKRELPDHSTCIRPIFYLIWSNHQTHRNCAVDTFVDIFFTKIGKNSTQQEVNFAIAENLCKFMGSKLSYGDFFTIEELIVSLVKGEKFPELVIKTLFQIFVRDIKKDVIDSDFQLRALILISMIGRGDSAILQRNMENIFELCYRKNTLNLDLARYGSVALNSIASSTNKKRLPVSNQIFKSMHILISSTLTDPTKNWVPFMMETIHSIFELAQDPFNIFSEIILHCSSVIKCISNEAKKLIGMSRFICLIGKVAQLHVVLLDKYIWRSDKINSTMTGQNFDTTSGENNNTNIPNLLTENEILSGVGLLARFKGLIINILQNYFQVHIKNSESESDHHPIILQLQSSSLFALSQYMLLSVDFCEEHINLLFTLLSKHPCFSIRESCICAISDLILRFPNILQPWLPLIFNSLRDSRSSVRKHTILMLSHLILIDMIKIQGHVAEIAYLLLDEDETISEIAKIFFSKISQKSNALYNSLADIISHILNIDNMSLDTDKLKFILKYLFSFIQKEKQVDNLVEKLITRLKTAQDNIRKDLIGYSISLLPHSDRTLKILIAEFPLIKLLVQDQQTKSHFIAISNSLHKKSISTQDANNLLAAYDSLLETLVFEERVQEKSNTTPNHV